jgi:SpoVK/Ycf46/Vps4 family AAA+-type ATPase
MRDPAKRNRCPMGILFAGPSGTGKTFLSRALANALGINCVEMSPDNIRGSYVGESEKKLKRAIQGVKAMSPCVLFIDEIDTKVRRPSGGGGGGGDSVEGNIFGKLLEFLGDTSHRGEILLVCATNRPDSIDAALKRPGRLDAKIPLLPPQTAGERASALAALARRHRVDDLGYDGWYAIGEQTDSYTQAELEGLVVQAASIRVTDEDELAEVVARRLKGEREPSETELLAEAFVLALEEVVPSTDDITWHTDLAISVCSNRRLVPERYRDRVGKQLARAQSRAQAQPQAARPGAGRVAIQDDDVYEDYDEEE